MENEAKAYTIFADGGSRGNPGEAAYGFVIYDENDNVVHEEGKRIGVNTNNVAEYSGILNALSWVEANLKNVLLINFFLDSQLAVMQLSGIWKIKNENLRNLYYSVKNIEEKIGVPIKYQHVMRERNKAADRQVNLALDEK